MQLTDSRGRLQRKKLRRINFFQGSDCFVCVILLRQIKDGSRLRESTVRNFKGKILHPASKRRADIEGMVIHDTLNQLRFSPMRKPQTFRDHNIKNLFPKSDRCAGAHIKYESGTRNSKYE